MTFFDLSGRRIPTEEVRVFSREPKEYYKIDQPIINYELILNRIQDINHEIREIKKQDFEEQVKKIIEEIKKKAEYRNLLNGVWVPFIYKRKNKGADLGRELEEELLPQVKHSFLEKNPQSEFRAILQSNSKLQKNISLDPDSRYEEFIQMSERKAVIGLYFPQALQGFDVASQRKQMKTLTNSSGLNICLSGGMDICSALVACPELLFSNENYSPIPIMAAYKHNDNRLILLLKSYGPNLEFWCMTQMLTSQITQVSEQWTGGMTVYIGS